MKIPKNKNLLKFFSKDELGVSQAWVSPARHPQFYIFYITYNRIQKNCKMLPSKINKWKIECIHLCFFPNAYKIAPKEYAIPPATNKITPAVPNSIGNKFAVNIMHHPIPK